MERLCLGKGKTCTQNRQKIIHLWVSERNEREDNPSPKTTKYQPIGAQKRYIYKHLTKTWILQERCNRRDMVLRQNNQSQMN